MFRIAFHANALTLRGTEVALYDYAHYNEALLGNRSLIIVPRRSNHDMPAVEKFRARFPIVLYEDKSEIDGILTREQCALLYCIKYGVNDGIVAQNIPTAVHCVFDMSQPHGSVYAAVSDFMSKRHGGTFPVVPHMIDLPNVPANAREQLGIPKNGIVFGRYGGRETFDLPFAQKVVERVAKERPDIFFAFMHTNPFCSLPNVRFIDGVADPIGKTLFINSCNAMLHARQEGETFGIACGEFSVRNKPVITYGRSEYTQHLDILGEKAVLFNSEEELYTVLTQFQPHPEKDWDAYSERYNPLVVMEIFRKTLLEPFGITPRPLPRSAVLAPSGGKKYWVLSNDNLSRNILRGEAWEPHITKFLSLILRPGGCAVDVGAAFGFHTVTCSHLVGKRGRVHSFEPQGVIFDLLYRNCLENRCPNVRLYHCAVAHKPGPARLGAMNYNEDGVNVGDAHLGSPQGEGEIINAISLDTAPIEQLINLIKVDVQGAERFVIEGARNRIAKDRPIMIVEFEDHCLQRYGYSSNVLFDLIRSLGYAIFYLEYSYPSDHVCVPKEKEAAFRELFRSSILPHASTNQLNHNFELGVREKISLLA